MIDIPEELVKHQHKCFKWSNEVTNIRDEELFIFQPPSARDNEKCASQIANNLSKKFGPGWNAVVGEAFSFEISYTK